MKTPLTQQQLVHEGSFMGCFDFVPKRLRVGPWCTAFPIYMSILLAKLVYWMPQKESFDLDEAALSAHPLAYEATWLYNVIIFFWMKFVLLQCLRVRGPGIVATYTIQSWIMLTTRHGLSALAPFLPRQHFLLWFNEMLRFPALATATITFCFWNFLIAPVHFFNIIFAVLNTLVTSSRQFEFLDLWLALAAAVSYAFFYLLVLDRIGVHLYPIFSPRTLWSVLSWSALLVTYFLVFLGWNQVISSWSPLFKEMQEQG
eukprot:scaffold34525_cov58-Cyclotella_meneghiniana.AAC.3